MRNLQFEAVFWSCAKSRERKKMLQIHSFFFLSLSLLLSVSFSSSVFLFPVFAYNVRIYLYNNFWYVWYAYMWYVVRMYVCVCVPILVVAVARFRSLVLNVPRNMADLYYYTLDTHIRNTNFLITSTTILSHHKYIQYCMEIIIYI